MLKAKDVKSKHLIPIVIYARYSSSNQREESITAQIRACKEYAEKQGYFVVKIYTDEEKSAQTDDRPNFLRMINDIKNGTVKADIVLVHKLDRFARNRYDSAYYKRELRRGDIRVESVLERLDDSPESIMLESMLEGMAEYYSKNLAREVMKGMRENAEIAKHNGGQPPYGLAVDENGRYYINDIESPAIKLIFEMYDKGCSYGQIIEALNQQEFKTRPRKRRGVVIPEGHFGKNSIHDILRNKKYAGIYTFNRAASKSLDGKRNNHKQKDADSIIEIPGVIPSIIPPDLFWRAQSKMDQNKKQHTYGQYKAQVTYLLSGVIWCGDCGYRMVGTSSSYHTRVSKEFRRKHHYRCGHSSRTGECKNPKIGKEFVEEFVLTELERHILNDNAIPVLAKKVLEYYLKDRADGAGEGDYLRKEVSKIENQIANLVSAIAAGGGTVIAIVEQLKSLEREKATLENRLQEWLRKQEQNLITEEQIIAHLQKYRSLILSKDEIACKRLIEEFVEKVLVKTDTVETTFKVSVLLTGGGEPYRVKSTVAK